jgi:[ribosomal protein S5]-alanine N-acetyltransferase
MTLPEQTARLFFRLWSEDDLPLAQALWGDARVTALIGGPFDAAERLRCEIEVQRDRGVQYWPIFLKGSGAHAGCCGLRPHRDIFELGFHLRFEQWGSGLATEASRAVIAHAFRELKLPALFAGHHPQNQASRRTLQKLGFRYMHDEPYPPTGKMHPSYLLAASDYFAVSA